ncbi:MAG: hypothetical protein ACRD0Z_12620 [Acidimicrobiales bacterium]
MNDFDFLVGEWTVANRRRQKLLQGREEWDDFPSGSTCIRLFDGAANVDWITFPTLRSAGMTLRLFDPVRKEWSLYWASSRDGILQPPVSGSFTDGVGKFYGDDTYDAMPIRVRYVWSEITACSARWEQAFSVDGQQSWETNWVMTFDRLERQR